MSERSFGVLAVTSELPWPLDTGGHLRTFHLLEALASEFPLTLVAGCRSGDRQGIDNLRRHGIAVHPAFVPARSTIGHAAHAAWSAVRRRPYVMFGRHDRTAVRAALRECCAMLKPRAVYLDHLDSFVFASAFGRLPLVLDLHNVYSLIARREAAEARDRWLRTYLGREATLLERAERRAVRGVDLTFAVSESERAYYQGLGAAAVRLVPNGVDCAYYDGLPAGRSARPPVILYVGTMSWGPNIDAALFLARQILPQLQARFPGLRLRIVGRDPAPAIAALAGTSGIEVMGRVADVRPHLDAATVLAVPLQAGGGTRLKILEAFAAGLPVVSSPVGCEGLDVTGGVHLLVADRDRFAEAIAAVLAQDDLRRGLAARAREMVRAQYDWTEIGARARRAVTDLLGSRDR